MPPRIALCRARQGEPEGASGARLALHSDVSFVGEHDLLDDCQTEARAGMGRSRHAEELFEQAPLVLGCDALAGVGHLEANHAILLLRTKLDVAAARGVL